MLFEQVQRVILAKKNWGVRCTLRDFFKIYNNAICEFLFNFLITSKCKEYEKSVSYHFGNLSPGIH